MHLHFDEKTGSLEIHPEDNHDKELLRGIVAQLEKSGFRRLRIETEDNRALDRERISRRHGGNDHRGEDYRRDYPERHPNHDRYERGRRRDRDEEPDYPSERTPSENPNR